MDDAAVSGAGEAPTLGDIQAAAARLAGHATRTPMLNAPALDEIAGRRIWVKAECLQKTGSFKFRGAMNAVSRLPQGAGVLAMSSGNHAQGVALAARLTGRSAVIVMPSDAPEVKLAATRGYGAEVVTYDRETGDRDGIAEALARERGLYVVPPYDHPDVIAGQGTCGLEIAVDLPAAVEEVLVCCGGGGLATGLALALEGRATIRTAEPEGFDDMARSLAAGERVANGRRGGSVCDAILTPMPGRITFPVLSRLAGPGVAVGDAEALRAVALAWRHLRIVLEPGGAVALAAALRGGPGDVCAVATGGNVERAVFARALDLL